MYTKQKCVEKIPSLVKEQVRTTATAVFHLEALVVRLVLDKLNERLRGRAHGVS